MPLTPLDIIQKQFELVRRGYDPDTVRAFLDETRESLETALQERHRAQEQLREKEREIEALHAEQAEIRDTLLLARRLSEDIGAGARREADLVVGEARLEAQRILASTSDEHLGLIDEVHRLRGEKFRLIAEIRAVLETHRRLLDEMEKG